LGVLRIVERKLTVVPKRGVSEIGDGKIATTVLFYSRDCDRVLIYIDNLKERPFLTRWAVV
jgi:hypothetical protein